MNVNKKGFTLIELISVVAILTIVSTLAVLSVTNLSQSIKEKQRENLLESIKVSAKKYVEETGIKKVYIDSLIKDGYVVSDKISSDRAIIVDPTDSSKELNCYYFDFTSDEGGVISSNPEYGSSSDICNYSVISDAFIDIVYSNNDAISDSWIKTNSNVATLKVISLNKEIITDKMLKDNSIWTTPLAPDVYDTGDTYQVTIPSDGYIERTYNVRVRIEGGKDYTISKIIRIDNSVPVIDNVRVSDEDSWKNAKFIYANFSDSGSGLAYFAITKSATAPSNSSSEWKNVNGSNFALSGDDLNNKIVSNGVYYVYVKDVVGNVAKSTPITVKKIDNTPPRCDHIGDNTYWDNKEVSITWTCESESTSPDNSPCATSITQKYSNMETKTYSYVIKDEAGNSTNCTNKIAYIYSDMTNPSVNSLSISSTEAYNSIHATYSISGSDSLSGIKYYCITSSNDSSSCNWKQASYGDITIGNQEGSGTKYTRYAFVMDNAGNISNFKSTAYELYTTCSEYIRDINSSFSSCSDSCGGTKSRPYIDKYLSTKCSLKEVVDCCDDIVNSNCGDWQCDTCSASCGPGTCTKAHRTCTKKTSCSNSCGTATETSYSPGTSCNNGPCCTITYTDDYCRNYSYYEYDNCNGEEYAGSCTRSGPYCIDDEELYLYCDPYGYYCYEKNDPDSYYRKSYLTLGNCETDDDDDDDEPTPTPSTKTMYLCRVDGFENGTSNQYGNTCVMYGGYSCYWAVKSYSSSHTSFEVNTTMDGIYYVIASGGYQGGKIKSNCLSTSPYATCTNSTCSG